MNARPSCNKAHPRSRGWSPPAQSGQWTSQDTTQFTALIQPLLSYVEGYDSVGFIVSGSIEAGVGGEEVPGVVTEVSAPTSLPYFYNFVGADIGLAEGAELSVGILIAKGKPDKLGGIQVFADGSATVVGGVGVQDSLDGQIFVFVSTGEELNISVGAGYVTVKQL